mmetsp:Transcript_14366/g.12659  ORF Transcript_14366/g.12659 Transcript_14366/m.12659 type:complete len:498 (+) Transcript_14366:286-1779(+)
MIQLNVTMKGFGIATFSFSVPNKQGIDRLIFKKEMIPAFDRIINNLNIRKSAMPTTNLVSFVRDTKKNRVYATYPYTYLEEDHFGSKQKEQAAFKKACYMVFSNSLLRLKSNKHLFHFLIKYPNLDVDDLLSRTDIQIRIANGIDHAQSYHLTNKTDDKEINQQNLKRKQILGIPIVVESKLFSLSSTLTGSIEAREKNDSKTFLGKGGFGEVRSGTFAGSQAAMKKFNCKKEKLSKVGDKSTKKDFEKEDYIRELRANLNINAKYFPKFFGLGFLKDGDKNPLLLTSLVDGIKLSQCYQDITEDYPEILMTIFIEISSAIAFIHEKTLYHGDLSLNNIILDHNSDTEEVKVYIIDFGLSNNHKNGKVWGHTMDFAAYEVLLPGSKDLSKIDIFAFGSILFYIFYRISFVGYLLKKKPPQPIEKKENYSNSVKRCHQELINKKLIQEAIDESFSELPQNNLMPNGLLDIIKQCLFYNPDERPSAFDLLKSLNDIYED